VSLSWLNFTPTLQIAVNFAELILMSSLRLQTPSQGFAVTSLLSQIRLLMYVPGLCPGFSLTMPSIVTQRARGNAMRWP
jgi:hypothetical protein